MSSIYKGKIDKISLTVIDQVIHKLTDWQTDPKGHMYSKVDIMLEYENTEKG